MFLKEKELLSELGLDQLPEGPIVGLDEAGRGPLAGAVFAAAVVLPHDLTIPGLNDSKKISAKKRLLLNDIIKNESIAWSIASASVEEIDTINILQASFLAMHRAFQGLQSKVGLVIVDGNRMPLAIANETKNCYNMVKADSRIQSVAAASILAKVARDQEMIDLHNNYPEYGFAQHKGYGTQLHIAMLQKYGPCPVHRKSFQPIKQLI